MSENKFETYGFRFLDTLNEPFCQLFAIGHDFVEKKHHYHWDGQKRIDGPLLLFQYTISGYGELVINDEVHNLEPGSAFMVEIPSKHNYYLPKDSESWEFFYLLIRPTNIKDQWLDLVRQLGSVTYIPPGHYVIHYLQNIFYAASKNHITDGYQASAIVYQFIMELYRFLNEYKKEKNHWPNKIQEAAKHIENQYVKLQSLEDIANTVGLSKYHFTRIFKKTTGYTPIEYLTKVRMEKSVALLQQTELTIDEIAKKVGYSSGSYFIKVFKKWLGFSPGEFRVGSELAAVKQLKFD